MNFVSDRQKWNHTTVNTGRADPSSDAYRQTVDAVVTALRTDVRRGLSGGEARQRLDRFGRNELQAAKPVPAWHRFLAQFGDVLVILLLVATAISAGLWAYERDASLPYEAIAILAVVLLNATMGFVQESRAEAATASMDMRAKPRSLSSENVASVMALSMVGSRGRAMRIP